MDKDAESRIALVADYLHKQGWSAPELRAACRQIVDDPVVAEGVRINKAITPADFNAAYEAALGCTRFEKRRRDEERVRQEQARASMGAISTRTVQVDPPRLRGRAENLRRLKQGTDHVERESEAWREGWDAYYDRDYVTDAQGRARAQLDRYSKDQLDDEL